MKKTSKTLDEMLRPKKDYEELQPVDDTGSVGGGYGNQQPQKPNEDWVKWIVFGFIAVLIALIIASVL